MTGMKKHSHMSLFFAIAGRKSLFFLLYFSQLIFLQNKVIHPDLAAVTGCDSHGEECGDTWDFVPRQKQIHGFGVIFIFLLYSCNLLTLSLPMVESALDVPAVEGMINMLAT